MKKTNYITNIFFLHEKFKFATTKLVLKIYQNLEMKKNWVKSYKNNQNTLIRLWDQAAVDDITVFDYDSATQQ